MGETISKNVLFAAGGFLILAICVALFAYSSMNSGENVGAFANSTATPPPPPEEPSVMATPTLLPTASPDNDNRITAVIISMQERPAAGGFSNCRLANISGPVREQPYYEKWVNQSRMEMLGSVNRTFWPELKLGDRVVVAPIYDEAQPPLIVALA